jgi:hypothetical protein
MDPPQVTKVKVKVNEEETEEAAVVFVGEATTFPSDESVPIQCFVDVDGKYVPAPGLDKALAYDHLSWVDKKKHPHCDSQGHFRATIAARYFETGKKYRFVWGPTRKLGPKRDKTVAPVEIADWTM